MNNSLIKYKDLALKVIYYTKKRQLGQKIFFATSKFQDILSYFEQNLKDSQTFLKSCYFLNGKQIYPSDILLYFCTVDPNLRLVEEDMFLEIEELEHLDDASEPIYEKLLKPLINPFRLVLLNIKEGTSQMVDFPKEKIVELGLDILNNDYACCNSTDSLYISQGKNFWIISNNNFEIEKKEMPFFKEKHSMTYILSNNTIFIAGGSEESFYYDINSKEFITWGKMSGVQEQPALIQYGDFLYSFNSFNTNGIYFEKTKLTNPAKKWEKLIPQSGDQESGFFYNQLYGVSKCSGGNILFAGGINNQLRTFIYNIKLNVLYINPSKDESVLLNERTFYKIDHNFNIAIPKNIENDSIIAIVNKNSKALNLVPFEQTGIKTRNNVLPFDNPRNRLAGNIIIQCRYMSIKDYENFLKQKEMQQNNKTKGGFDIYNRKEQSKKLGDKIKGDPYRYQYRGKTPLALERINEGKSDEENEDDDIGKNKSSSAKKEKRTLDLGLKMENIGKFNLATEKREEENKSDNNISNINNKDDIEVKNIKQENKENINLNNLNINKEELKNKNSNSTNNIKNRKPKELNIDNEDNEHNYHSDLEPEELYNQQNTHTEIKQKIKNNNSKSNIKENKIDENKKNNNDNEILNNENKQEMKKIYNSLTDTELNKNRINKNLIKNLDEEGLNNGTNNISELSSTPYSNLANLSKVSKINNNIINNNINMNMNMKNIFQIKKDTKEINNKNINNNININLNNNFKKINININTNANNSRENKRIERRQKINNPNHNSNENIHQNIQIQNRILSSSGYNINDMNKENLKKIIDMPKSNNNIQNLKNKENNMVYKSNTNFISSMISNINYQHLNNNTNANINTNYININNNPFIDNSKYHNISEKQTYHLKNEIEPNANKILTNKNMKTIKEIKKSQKKKTNYKTNTVTSIPIDTQNILSESNPNLNSNQNNNIDTKDKNNLSNNKIISSYKASTHKLSKGKKIPVNNHNNTNNKININTGNNGENLNFSAIPINKKIFKNNITPDQKRIKTQKSPNIQTEGNLKREMYIKNRQKFETQRLNTTNNLINTSGNNIGNKSLRILKSDKGLNIRNQQYLTNEQILRESKKVIVTKDGKRYVLVKNIQTIRKEEDDDKFRNIEERRKIYNSHNLIEGNH